MSTKTKNRMDASFSVFNGHVNNASDRADAEFIAQFGQEKFDEVIAPLHKDGIMAIFTEPTPLTMAWVALVTAYVNEDRGEHPEPEPSNAKVVLVHPVGTTTVATEFEDMAALSDWLHEHQVATGGGIYTLMSPSVTAYLMEEMRKS